MTEKTSMKIDRYQQYRFEVSWLYKKEDLKYETIFFSPHLHKNKIIKITIFVMALALLSNVPTIICKFLRKETVFKTRNARIALTVRINWMRLKSRSSSLRLVDGKSRYGNKKTSKLMMTMERSEQNNHVLCLWVKKNYSGFASINRLPKQFHRLLK